MIGNQYFKERLALGIMHHVGNNPLNETQKALMVDIFGEYEKIQKKECMYTRSQRDAIEAAYNGIQNTLEQRKNDTDTSNQ